MHQLHSTEVTQSDPPSIDDTENSELQINQIKRNRNYTFRLKINTKHQLNRIIIKTKKNLKFLKSQIIHKIKQTIPNKNLKEVQVQALYTKIEQRE